MIAARFAVLAFSAVFTSSSHAQACDVEWTTHSIRLDDGRQFVIAATQGIVELRSEGIISPDESAPTGAILLYFDTAIICTTTNVPLQMELAFGSEYRVAEPLNGEEIFMIQRFEFPRSPDGAQLPPYDFHGTTADQAPAGFMKFEEDAPELNLPGLWRITLIVEGKPVVSHEFMISDQGETMDIDALSNCPDRVAGAKRLGGDPDAMPPS